MGADGGAGIVHEPHVAKKCLEQPAGLVAHAKARDERLAGGVGGRLGGARDVAREHRGPALDARERGARGGQGRGGLRVGDDERGEVVA